MARRSSVALVLAVGLVSLASVVILKRALSDQPSGGRVPAVVESTTGPIVDRYGRWELTLGYPTDRLENPWEDVRVDAKLRAPSGRALGVKGFFYEADRYKLRFAPAEIGTYSYTVTVNGPKGVGSTTGSFRVVASASPGFVRTSKANPYQLVFDNGQPYNAIGVNECLNDENDNGKLDEMQMDGEVRPGGHDSDSGAAVVDIKTYLKAYGSEGAGFNLLRWNPENCGFAVAERISVDGNRYLERQGKMGDELVATARAEGFRILFTLFYKVPYPNAAERPSEADALKRYMDYAVARWGADVDIWELTNETLAATPGGEHSAEPAPAPPHPGGHLGAADSQPAPTSDRVSDDWLRMVADHLRRIDPNSRMVTNSYPRALDNSLLDARSPHWYGTETPDESDLTTIRQIEDARQGLPIIFGEQGNMGLNWDPESAMRMRIRAWTATFQQSVLVFWNLSFAKDCDCLGIYLGPQERGYIRSLQTFRGELGRDLRPAKVDVVDQRARAYGLSSSGALAVYLVNTTDRGSATTATIDLEVPFDGVARWVDPSTAQVISSGAVARGQQQLVSPPFGVDAALRISRR